MSSFNDLLLKRSKHQKKKRKRATESQSREVKRQATDKPLVTLENAIQSLLSSSLTTPLTETSKSLTKLIFVGVLVGHNFPHQELWKYWCDAVQRIYPHIQVEISFVSRFVSPSPSHHSAFQDWIPFVKERRLEIGHTVSWGSVDEVRAVLALMSRAESHVKKGHDVKFVMCDSETIPGSTNIERLFAREDDGEKEGQSEEVLPAALGYSRDIQFQCMPSKLVPASRLRRMSPWGMVLDGSILQQLLRLESGTTTTTPVSSSSSSTTTTTSTTTSTTITTTSPPRWYNQFATIPCSSEIYFATLIHWLGSARVTCCVEEWSSSSHQQDTDARTWSWSSGGEGRNEIQKKFMDLRELKLMNEFFVLRRVTESVPLDAWASMVGLHSSPVPTQENVMLTNISPAASPVASSLSSSSSSSSSSTLPPSHPPSLPPSLKNKRENIVTYRMPTGKQGGGRQQHAWYDDVYLQSIDPPACGIGNKFFIYSAYRIYSEIHQKKMSIHNKSWLSTNVFQLPLESENFDCRRAEERQPRPEDYTMIEAVFQKATMYLQWSPFVLSWKKKIRQWFAPFVQASIDKVTIYHTHSLSLSLSLLTPLSLCVSSLFLYLLSLSLFPLSPLSTCPVSRYIRSNQQHWW